VVPARVQAALDVMAEGVLVLDENERIVLANSRFAEWVGRSPASLLGKKASGLSWGRPGASEPPERWPWVEAVRESRMSGSARLLLSTGSGQARSLVVKGAPVLDGWGKAKGAIATFDDVTELEQKTEALEKALTELEKSQAEIELQNQELQVLARRDPLTGVSNRRAFFDVFEPYFNAAKRDGRRVSCIMTDIDHFKRVNDTHGHQTGDEVIRRVSEVLASAVRTTDAVCRYGGEEFCIVLPDAAVEAAVTVAERLRRKIEAPGFARVPVTASFGVTSSAFGASSLTELINQADEALYASKEGGRNRVTRWDQRPEAAG
jgi:diguanylate cyclase (GGDEF)-like protein/PAS domain S-box-containing protein